MIKRFRISFSRSLVVATISRAITLVETPIRRTIALLMPIALVKTKALLKTIALMKTKVLL